MRPPSRYYSVKDVARAIAYQRDPETIQKVIRQVRHWTNHDLIRPIGDKTTGTGVSRIYDADGVRGAAIAQEHISWGLTAEDLCTLGESLDDWRTTKEWNDAVEGRKAIFMRVSWDRRADVLMTQINQKQIQSWPDFPGNEITGPIRPVSALTINLTALFKGIEL